MDVGIAAHLYIDGERIGNKYLKAGQLHQVLGIRNTASSVLPFKFQELELVGAFPRIGQHVVCFSFATEDPDIENVPVVPEFPAMGTIELRAFRCRTVRAARHREHRIRDYKLHQGCVSERSKKAGWHRVRYVLRLPSHPSQLSFTRDTH